jgi:hypothetical protein
MGWTKGDRILAGAKFPSPPNRPDRHCGPTQPRGIQRVKRFFPSGKAAEGVMLIILTIHLYPAPKLRINRSIRLFPTIRLPVVDGDTFVNVLAVT